MAIDGESEVYRYGGFEPSSGISDDMKSVKCKNVDTLENGGQKPISSKISKFVSIKLNAKQ